MSYRQVNIFASALLVVACFISCKNQDMGAQYNMPVEKDNSLELLADVNKYLTYKDQDIIEGYIKRHDLPMNFYEAGYYSLILKVGSGTVVDEGDEVFFTCKVSLLDGTELYDNTMDNPKSFLVGKTKEIKGLQIGLVGVPEGSHVLFIFPPHLTYGLIGDKNKIPPRANLLYDVEVIKVNKR